MYYTVWILLIVLCCLLYDVVGLYNMIWWSKAETSYSIECSTDTYQQTRDPPFATISYYIMLYYIMLHYITLHYIVLHCIILYYTILYSAPPLWNSSGPVLAVLTGPEGRTSRSREAEVRIIIDHRNLDSTHVWRHIYIYIYTCTYIYIYIYIYTQIYCMCYQFIISCIHI